MGEQPPRFGLSDLLSPVSIRDFFDRSFQRRPLVLPANPPGSVGGLLSLADVESLVSSLSTPDRSSIQLVRESRSRPLTPPLVDERGGLQAGAVFAAYREGFTLVLNQLHLRWPPVRALCDELAAVFDTSWPLRLREPVAANLYLTPPDSQGFLPHYDDQDVFVIQLQGAKQWRVYPEMAPGTSEPLGSIPRQALPPPTHDLCLRAGDRLYLPAGFPHEAAATDDMSMHVTVGVRSHREQARAMAVGAEAGPLLQILLRQLGSKRILELGTGVGRRTLWLAEAARANGGRVVTVDRSERKLAAALGQFAAAALLDVVEPKLGDAVRFVEEASGPWDFVLIALGREACVPCFERLAGKLAPGALVLVTIG